MIIPVNLDKNGYDIIFERGALQKVSDLLNLDRKVLIVTDDGVPPEYAEEVRSVSSDAYLTVMPAGEESKSFKNLEKICHTMLQNSFTRNDCVIAVGGGVVGDLAGFAASCYMRGIDFYNVPTTLLSQVDSSVGGKTAIDLDGIKNIVGSFYQPKKVIIDPKVLDTLSKRNFACGAAEIIKMAVCFDRKLFELIEEKGVKNCLEEAITGALKIKAAVVEKDEKEGGLRRALNLKCHRAFSW